MKRLLICLILSGCQSLPTQEAVLAAPSTELNDQLAKLLNNNQLILADDVFMHDSKIFIERNRHATILTGKNLEKPEAFSLSLIGKTCWLTRISTGEKRQLKEAQCKAK